MRECLISHIENIFCYKEYHRESVIISDESKTEEDDELVRHVIEEVYENDGILPELTMLDLSDNPITELPHAFNISSRRLAKRPPKEDPKIPRKPQIMTIRLCNTFLREVSLETLKNLGESAPVDITLDLRENKKLSSVTPLMETPKNVHLLTDIKEEDLKATLPERPRTPVRVRFAGVEEEKKE